MCLEPRKMMLTTCKRRQLFTLHSVNQGAWPVTLPPSRRNQAQGRRHRRASWKILANK